MNEIERAIRQFAGSSEAAKKIRENEPETAPICDNIIAMNDTAIAALREKQEREKGCEFCAECEDLAYGQDSMQRTGRIYLDGNLLTADLYSESMAVAVCYCPMCGKRLEDKT